MSPSAEKSHLPGAKTVKVQCFPGIIQGGRPTLSTEPSTLPTKFPSPHGTLPLPDGERGLATQFRLQTVHSTNVALRFSVTHPFPVENFATTHPSVDNCRH